MICNLKCIKCSSDHKTTTAAVRSNDIAANIFNALSTTIRLIERALPLGKGTVTSEVL